MFISKQILLRANLVSILVCFTSIAHAAVTSDNQSSSVIPSLDIQATGINKSYFYAELLYVKPYSDNLKYATFVSGTQPYSQSWHYQAINPSYHPAFDIGFNYAIPHTLYSAAANWVHLNSNDSDSKQASTNTDLNTVEFVGPPYEMSPPVFGIKHVNAKVNFAFDQVAVNAMKWVDFSSHLHAQFLGGINLLRLNQTLTTIFSDYAGSPATPYSYPLPPDPSFSFQTRNVSKYLGAGPDIGVNIQYVLDSGFGVMGEFLGLVSAGTMQANDYFTSTSSRLTSLGLGTSHQEITSPNATQTVFGTDSKLGILYKYHSKNIPELTLTLGYRIVSYINAISTVSPNTLVQPGTVLITPEFSTGTMAIVSTNAVSRPFSFSGPFINLKIAIS